MSVNLLRFLRRTIVKTQDTDDRGGHISSLRRLFTERSRRLALVTLGPPDMPGRDD
jgi:hypothetical protein